MSARPLFLSLFLLLTVPVGAESFVVVAEPYPPYEYIENGQPMGTDYEMLELASARAGVSLKYVFVPWARALAMVKQGSADAVVSLRRTSEREAYLWFSSVALDVSVIELLAHPGYTGNPKTIAELSGQAVGTTLGHYYGSNFEEAGLERIASPDAQTMLRRLSQGDLLVGVFNTQVARYWMEKLGVKNLRRLPVSLDAGVLTVAFSKASPRGKELFEKLEKALIDLEAEGRLETIRAKYRD